MLEALEALEETRLALERAQQAEDQISRARVWETAGIAQRHVGLFETAIDSYQRCITLASELGGPAHPVSRGCLGQLALAKAMAGDRPGAMAGLERLKALEGESESVSRFAERSIFQTLIELGRFDEAVPHIDSYRKRTQGRNDGMVLLDLARVRQGQGEDDEARRLFEQAHQFLLGRYGPEHPLVLDAFEKLNAASQGPRST